MDLLIDLLPFKGCSIRRIFHIYCPFCGGTRALKEFLKLHILNSVKCNPVVLMIVIYIVIFFVMYLLEHRYYYKNRFMKHRLCIAYIMFGLLIIFTVIRNISVHYFGIDYLGDILIR